MICCPGIPNGQELSVFFASFWIMEQEIMKWIIEKTSEVSKNQFTVAPLALALKGMGLLKDKGSGMAPSMQPECGFKFSFPPVGASRDALLILYKMCNTSFHISTYKMISHHYPMKEIQVSGLG